MVGPHGDPSVRREKLAYPYGLAAGYTKEKLDEGLIRSTEED